MLAIAYAKEKHKALTFDERIEILEQQTPTEDQQKFIKMILYTISRIIRDNIPKHERKQFIDTVVKILRFKNGKQATCYLTGKASSGKTTMITFLTSIWEHFEKGTLSESTKTEFFMDELPGKNINVFEEVKLNKIQLGSFKKLLEGNPILKADMKGTVKEDVEPRPTIMAANYSLLDDFKPEDKEALKHRMFIVPFTHPYAQDDKNMDLTRKIMTSHPDATKLAFLKFLKTMSNYEEQLEEENLVAQIPDDLSDIELFSDSEDDMDQEVS